MEAQELEQQKELNTNLKNKMTEKEKHETEAGLEKEKAKTGEEATKQLEKAEVKKDKKPETKKTEKPKVKKTEAIVRAFDIPISTKQSLAICRFIKGKPIPQAIRELEEVSLLRKAVPVKGEHPHKKGRIMAGKYPQKAAKNFIILLKSLAANASDVNDPFIIEAIANIGSRPYGRFGTVRKKRTHIFIKAKEKGKQKNKKSQHKPNQLEEKNKLQAIGKKNGREKNS